MLPTTEQIKKTMFYASTKCDKLKSLEAQK